MQAKLWRFWLWLSRNSVWIIGIIIASIGACGVWRISSELGQRFSEAMLIAGILSISVDLWLKRKLQEDAARDIFHHLLGFSLPDELRRKLQRFVEENAIYRKDVSLTAHAEDTADGVILTITATATNVAAANTTYQQSLTFEESLEGKPIYASLRSSTHAFYALENAALQLKETDEPMLQCWKGDEVPMSRGDQLHSYAKFSVRRARNDFYVLFFGYSLINPTLRITASDTLCITASKDESTQINGTEYFYNRVFLQTDHIQIRWKPKINTA